MNLVRLIDSYDNPVYVNPSKVIALRPRSSSITQIQMDTGGQEYVFGNRLLEVAGNVDRVAALLNGVAPESKTGDVDEDEEI